MTAAATLLAVDRATTAEPRLRPRILVAEDQEAVRRAIARTLRRRGFDVSEAGDGVQALQLAMSERPDLALVDLRIPALDGFAVIERLKRLYGSSLPIIVMSGMSDPGARLRAFDAGADDFVAKPVHVPELLKRIDAFERAHRAYVETVEARERADHLRLYAAEAVALLAHDLNNGLCTALSNLSYLQDVASLEGEPAEALAAAARAVQRMSGLVRNFVDISRLEDAALVPQLGQVDVGRLLADTLSIHQPDAQHHGASITCICPPDVTACIDGSLFERVLHNVIGNAVRYVRRDGVIGVRVRVESLPGSTEETLVVDVGNTGPTLPDELAATLFDKYQTGRNRKACSGMGLYFCRLAAEAHGGTIELASTAEYDVNFRIRLPKAGPGSADSHN